MREIILSAWIKPLIVGIFGSAAGTLLLWQGCSRVSAVAGGDHEAAARIGLKAGGILVIAISLGCAIATLI